MSPAKTVEAIEMPFATKTRVGPGKHLLHIADRFEANTVLRSFNTIQPSSLSCHFEFNRAAVNHRLTAAKEDNNNSHVILYKWP